MLFLTIFLIIGIGIGLSIRKIAALTKTSEKVLTLLYYPCLFLMGILCHLDEEIVFHIDKIGWHSFSYLIAAFAAGIIVIWTIHKIYKLLIQVKRN